MYIASGQRMHVGSQFHFILAGSVPVDGILSYLFIYFFFIVFLNICLLLGRGVNPKFFLFSLSFFGVFFIFGLEYLSSILGSVLGMEIKI